MRPYLPALAREGAATRDKAWAGARHFPDGRSCVALRGDGGGARRTCSLNGGCD